MPNPLQIAPMAAYDPDPNSSTRPSDQYTVPAERQLPILVPVLLLVLILFIFTIFFTWLFLQLENWSKIHQKGMTRWRERKEVDMERVGILREEGSIDTMHLRYGSGDSSPKKSVRFSEETLLLVDDGQATDKDGERKERMRLLRAEEVEEQVVFQQQTEMYEESFGADERGRAIEAEAEARFLGQLEGRREISSERENEDDVRAEFETRVGSGESSSRLVDPDDDAPAEGEYLGEGRVYFREDGMRHIQE